jgi:hypothetical protein
MFWSLLSRPTCSSEEPDGDKEPLKRRQRPTPPESPASKRGGQLDQDDDDPEAR